MLSTLIGMNGEERGEREQSKDYTLHGAASNVFSLGISVKGRTGGEGDLKEQWPV